MVYPLEIVTLIRFPVVYIVEDCVLTATLDLWASHSTFDETLDNTRRCEGIIPQDDLIIILYEGVWLDK